MRLADTFSAHAAPHATPPTPLPAAHPASCVHDAGAAAATAAGSEPGSEPAAPGMKLRLKMEGTVDDVSLCLNLDDAPHLRHPPPDSPSGAHSAAAVEEAIRAAGTWREGYTPLP